MGNGWGRYGGSLGIVMGGDVWELDPSWGYYGGGTGVGGSIGSLWGSFGDHDIPRGYMGMGVSGDPYGGGYVRMGPPWGYYGGGEWG